MNEHLLSSNNNFHLIGGAIIGVPETICSDMTLVLTSEPILILGREDDDVLTSLGKVIAIPSMKSVYSSGNTSNDEDDYDIGSASLINTALILSITFGIAGHELAHIMLSQYIVLDDDHNVDENDSEDGLSPSSPIIDLYSNLVVEISPNYQKMLYPIISKSFVFGQFEMTYVPAATFNNLLQRIYDFLTDDLMGIPGDEIFLLGYIQSLKLIPATTTNTEEARTTTTTKENKEGPAAWTKYIMLQQKQQQQQDEADAKTTIISTTPTSVNDDDEGGGGEL